MKVALLANEWGPKASATEVARWCASSWTDATPHATVTAVPVPSIGPRLADSMDPHWSRVGGVVTTRTALGLMLVPAGGAGRFNPHDLATGLLGLAAGAATGAAPAQVIIPLGDHAPAGDATDVWGGGIEAMRAAVAPLTMVALVTHPRPLLGLGGMSAAVMDGREGDRAVASAAQEQERRWSQIALTADAAVTSLLGGRLSDAPGTGAAGGLAYCLAVIGARLQQGVAHVADAVGGGAVDDADLVVVAVPQLNPRECDYGLVRYAADRAARRAVPCVVIAHDIAVGRRDVMAAGISAAYESDATAQALVDEVSRVAVTWTRHA